MHYSPAAKKHKFLNGLFSLLNTSIRFCNIFRFCMAFHMTNEDFNKQNGKGPTCNC